MVKKIYSKHYREPDGFRIPPAVLHKVKVIIKSRLAIPLFTGLVFAAVVAGLTLSVNNKPETKSAFKSLVFTRQLIGQNQYIGEIKGVMKTALGVKKDGGRVTVSRDKSSLEFIIPIDNPTLNSQDVGILQATDVSFASKDKVIAAKYNLLPNGIKEEIILNKIPKENTFPLTMKTENLEVKLNPDNIPVFYDRLGKYQFHFERPFVKDGSGQVSYGVRYKFIDQNNKSPELFEETRGNKVKKQLLTANKPLPDSEYILVIEIDEDWLHDPKRVLPIIIDPTVVHDTSGEFSGQYNRSVNIDDVLQFDSTNVAAGNAYTYVKALSDNTVVTTGDTIEYDVFLVNNLDQIGGIDIYYTDLSFARGSGWVDQNAIDCHPSGDISGYAYNQWYHRVCTITGTDNGKTISYFDLVNERDGATSITAYYDNIVIKNSGGETKSSVYASGSPDFNTIDFSSNGSNTGTVILKKGLSSTTSNNIQTYYQELPADEHTVGLWHMNEVSDNGCSGGQDACDSSGNGLHGTASAGSTITTTAQRVGSAARSFNGSNGYFTIPASAKLDVQRLTIEAWTYSADYVQNGFIFEKTTNGSVNTQYSCFFSSGSGIIFRTYNTTPTIDSLTVTLANAGVANNAWNHIACVYDGSTKKIYVNGNEVASSNYSQTLQTNPAGTSIVGAYGTGQNYFFNGILDEIRISDTARTPEEIKLSASRRPYSIYTSDIIDATKVSSWNSLTWTELGVTTGDGETLKDNTSLVAQWNFNETSGTAATNDAGSCGASCNGTLTGFASTASQDQATGTGWTADNRRWGAGALMFDGSDDYVSISDTSALDLTSAVTLESWVKFNSLTSFQTIIGKRDVSVTEANYVFRTFNNQFEFYFYANSSWQVYTTTNVNLEIGRWYQVVAVYDGNLPNIYLNGKLLTGSCTAGTCNVDMVADDNSLAIGRPGDLASQYFNGTIDSTRIYSRALSAAEILSNYNSSNLELQTRVGDSTDPNDGTWEVWKPTTGETIIESFDNDQANWSIGTSLSAKSAFSLQNSNPNPPSGPTNCVNNLPVIINNFGNNSSLTDYPVQLRFSYQTGMSSDFSDVRFTNSTGANLDYWLETYTTSSKATTWIEINSIPANKNTTIYMWYNGCTGGNTSSGTGTFSFFDNFDAEELNTNVWSVVSGTAYSVSSSVLQITVGAIGMVNPLGFNMNDGYIAESRMQYTSNSEAVFGGALETSSSQFTASGNTNADSTILHMYQNPASGINMDSYFADGSLTGYNIASGKVAHSLALNTWVILGDEMTPTSAGLWRNNSSILRYPVTWSKNLNYISLGYFSGSGTANIKDTSYDWVRVRKYSPIEPIAELASTTPAITIGGGSLKTDTGNLIKDLSTMAIWHLDETGGSSAYIKDSSGSGFDGTPTGTAVVNGISGKARGFNGSSDYVTLGDLSMIDNAANLTVEAWVYTTTSDANHHRVFTETNVLYVGQYSNQVSFYMGNGTSWVNSSVAMGTLTPNSWHHVAWVKNGTTASVYIDGIFSNSMDAPATLGTSSNINYLGGVASTQPWGGNLDEIRISSTARTSEEIAESYRLGRDHYLNKTISSTDLSGKSSLPFYVAADRPGTYLETSIGETPYANYQPDADTAGLWHLDEEGRNMPSFFDYDSFEGGPGSSDDWADRNQTNPDITDTTAFTGKYSLHMPRSFGRNFEGASGEPSGPYDTNTYPYMCMAYKIPSSTVNNMLIYINELPGWRSITMTQGESPTSYAKVASWNPLTANNEWQYECINLDSQLDSSLGTGTHTINSVIWHDGGGQAAITGEFWIDDFIISSAPYYPQGLYARDASSNSEAAFSVPSDLVSATGGTITSANGYRTHTFTSSGTLTVSGGTTNADALVVAGGGGGANTGSGGGAGGMLYSSLPLSSQAYSITVGGGGAGGATIAAPGANGSNSVFSTLTAIGGGGGRTHGGCAGASGGSGSGGPITATTCTATGGTGTSGQGNTGGAGYLETSWIGNSGGGGGAGGVGAAGGNAAGTGNGGVGRPSTISGTTTFYAGGGGGGEVNGSYVGAGGNGGGGSGVLNAAGTNGTANTGGGGGGGSYTGTYFNGGNGGSGIAVVRYPLSQDTTQSNVIGTSTVQGKIGKSRYFNGSTDKIISPAPSFDYDNITIEAWINPSTLSTRSTILDLGTETSLVPQLEVGTCNTGANAICVITPGVWQAQTSNNVITTGNWYYIAYTKNGAGATHKIYINGIEQSLAINTSADYASSSNYLVIGGRSLDSQPYNGSVDELRISSVARTADEIRQAYEVGLRTHNITIDFAASLDSGNLIADSSDVSFTVDATSYGLTNKASKLFSGDKIIVRENYDGTEYIAQGTVSSVNESTGATTVVSWDAGSTFPSSGYSVNASVFKWQREYWNITEPLDSELNAVTNITLRVTNGSEGRTIWIDDLKSAGDYLTTPGGSTITSAVDKKYFQYRVIEHSSDENVSASLTSVTLDYEINSAPNTPTLNYPNDTQTNLSLSTAFQTTATDINSDNLQYKIEVCEDLAMTTGCNTFDQTSSQSGWNGQNADGNTTYTSGTEAIYMPQLPFTFNPATTYYWRTYAIDPSGINEWGTTQGTPYSFTTTNAPSAPSTPYAEGATNPTGVVDTTPEFSAIQNDPDGDDAMYYQIEVNTQADFLGTSMWDSGKQFMTTTANGVRSPDISYAGTAIPLDGAGTAYYWRIKFWDSKGAEGSYTAAQSFTMNVKPGTPSLDSPTDTATNQDFLATLKTTGADTNSDYLRYRIQMCTDDAMTLDCQIFDQTSSQTGWSGQNAETSTAYTSGTQANYTIQSPLDALTTYYWRSDVKDPGGSNTWSATQATPYSFTTASINTPTSCRIEKAPDNSYLTVKWNDNSAAEANYEVQKSEDGGGFSLLQTLAANTESHQDNAVTNGHSYQYRVAAVFSGSVYSEWCTTGTVSLSLDLNKFSFN